jgi:hypothetical protein
LVGYKSEKCMQNEHGLCEGEILQVANNSKITIICECQCHDSMYQLTQRMQVAKSQ